MKIHQILIIVTVICAAAPAYSDDAARARIQALKARLQPALELSIEELQLALTIKVRQKFEGASIIAADEENTFLGKITSGFSSDSIFNDVGRFGSSVSSTSIWNDVGRFGGDIARLSPFNSITSSPPYIFKDGQVIGRLTVNKMVRGAIDPNLLKASFKD